MKKDKLRIGVITAALAMMIAGGVLTWQQDARNGKADQAKQGETAQLTDDNHVKIVMVNVTSHLTIAFLTN